MYDSEKPDRRLKFSLFNAIGSPLLAGFVVLFSLGAFVVMLMTDRILIDQMRSQINAELLALNRDVDQHGIVAIAEAVDFRVRNAPGGGVYYIGRLDGTRVMGNILAPPEKATRPGWHVFRTLIDDENGAASPQKVIVRTSFAGGDFPLMLGRRADAISSLRWRIGIGAGVASLFASIAGVWLLKRAAQRFEERAAIITSAMEKAENRSLLHAETNRPDELGRLAGNVEKALSLIDRQISHLSALSTVIAHETRAPLGLAQRALSATPPEIDEALLHVEDAQRLGLDLLDIASAESAHDRDLQLVSLSEVIENAIALCEDTAHQKNVRITEELSSSAQILGERLLLVRLFANLIDNAITASPEHATVTVTGRSSNGQAEIIVADQGEGLEAGDLDSAITAGGVINGGTGTGLRLVRAIALRHGAKVRLEKSGSGFAVRVIFPIPQS
ncbi:MAG: HAMP domain-containing sensor histidine kinase [Pseudomonadota bacterium]